MRCGRERTSTSHVWLIYSGATVAPQANIFEDGLRLRVAGGSGGYTYTGERRGELVGFTAETAFAEALVGYLKRFGPLTAKAFVGIAAIEHSVTPLDPENPVQGQELGPKLVTELWLNMGNSAWSSLDVSWTSAHQTAAARSRTGYRVFGDVSLGIEGGLNANDLGEDAAAACSRAMPGMAANSRWPAASPAASWKRRNRCGTRTLRSTC